MRIGIIILGSLAAACPVLASARPATAADIEVTARGPTAVHLKFTYSGYENVWFEVEQTTNGARIPQAAEAALSQSLRRDRHGPLGDRLIFADITGLTPETHYCFRVWSREQRTDVQSEIPSEWKCARTPPFPPLAPLDVKVQLTDAQDVTPHISWSTPDQSGHRPIAQFIVERQSPPGINRPWVLDATVPGPAGARGSATQAYSVEGGQIDVKGRNVYRVCAMNEAERACAREVLPTPPPRKLVGAADNPALDPRRLQAAPQPGARIEPSTPLAGTSAVSRPLAAAQGSQPGVPQAVAGLPAATRPAAASQPAPGDDRGIIIVGGKPQPGEGVLLNPQPLPPRVDPTATAQPASPKGTALLKRREPELIEHGPMQTRDASTAKSGLQIQDTATSPAAGSAAGAAAQEIETVEIVCRGGDGLRIESKGTKQDAGGASSVLMHLFYSPAFSLRNASGTYSPAGRRGNGLTPSSCSFADREWNPSDWQQIVFETAPQGSALTPGEGAVKKMLHDAEADPTRLAEVREDEKSIPEYLSNSTNYWRFQVYRTNYGHFVATSHGPWKPLSPETTIDGTTVAATEPPQALPFTRIRVDAKQRGVEFRFNGPPDSTPELLVFKGPVKLTANGGSWDGPASILKAVKVSGAKPSGVAEFFASSVEHGHPFTADARLEFVPGTHYHYFLYNKCPSTRQDHPCSSTRQEGTFDVPAETAPQNTAQPGMAAPGEIEPTSLSSTIARSSPWAASRRRRANSSARLKYSTASPNPRAP